MTCVPVEPQATLPIANRGVVAASIALVLCMLIGAAAASADIPIRVFHSPGNDGSFNYLNGGTPDPEDPEVLIEPAVFPARAGMVLDVWYWNGDATSAATCLNEQGASVTCVCFLGAGDELVRGAIDLSVLATPPGSV